MHAQNYAANGFGAEMTDFVTRYAASCQADLRNFGH